MRRRCHVGRGAAVAFRGRAYSDARPVSVARAFGCAKRVRAGAASLLCPIRWRKEPCDGQHRNEDQDANRKVIDHVPENSWPSAHIKSSGRRPNAKAIVSAMPTKAIVRITGIMAVPLF